LAGKAGSNIEAKKIRKGGSDDDTSMVDCPFIL
jgi:hypothetical protein